MYRCGRRTNNLPLRSRSQFTPANTPENTRAAATCSKHHSQVRPPDGKFCDRIFILLPGTLVFYDLARWF